MSRPEIGKAAKAKAKALLNARSWQEEEELVARFIQEVSDAAKEATDRLKGIAVSSLRNDAIERLAPFILPEPVDPLVEALQTISIFGSSSTANEHAALLREALAKRGLKIVEIAS